MAHRWEVYIFNPKAYQYELVYGGRSTFKAVKAAVVKKLKGSSCVRVEWR